MFFKKSACSQSLSPLGHSDSFASCKAWCVLISASLPKTPFPVKGCVCFVGSASCRAFGHTRPASVPGLSVGLPPSPRLGLRPKPHFQKLYRFIDSLPKSPPLLRRGFRYTSMIVNACLCLLYLLRLLYLCRYVREQRNPAAG